MRSVIVACILAIVGAGANAQDPAYTLEPRGSTIINPGGGPGGEITIDVFVDNVVAPNRLRAYQMTLEIIPAPGSTGSMGLVDPDTPSPNNESIFVDIDRVDWVFAGRSAFVGTNPSALQIAATLLSAGDSDPVTEPKYCGTYILKASSDASGDFQVRLLVADPGDLVQPTFLVDQNGILISPFTVVPPDGITVSIVSFNVNDNCPSALPVTDGITGFTTDNATTDGPSHPGSGCDQAGFTTIINDIWYDYVASCSGILSASTCGTVDFDTRVAVYDGCACPASDADLLVCNDNSAGCSGLTSEAVFDGVIEGACYKIRIGATGNLFGSGTLRITCIGNDLCVSAEPLSPGSSIQGATRNTALNDAIGPDCGLGFVDSPGVWYSVVGTGNLMTASLPSASFDTRLTVYDGACAALSCVGDANNVGGSQESVEWCSTTGVPYLILVHGGAGGSGTFTLNLTDTSCDDGNACTTDNCFAGACVNDPNFNDTDFCCAPSTGNLTLIDDQNPCTNDNCNPGNGIVSHPPVPDGVNVGCDDASRCTLDECQSGQCTNEDINTMQCQSDLDCPGETICGDGTGGTEQDLCFCIPGPRLELIAEAGALPVEGCYAVGEFLLVRVEMGIAEDPIVGAQFFLEYDASTLVFLSIEPGAAIDGSSPFALEFRETVDEDLGTIDYVVGANFGSPTLGPATVAFATFQVISQCSAFVRYRQTGPDGQTNGLTALGGVEVTPDLVDLPPVSVNGSPPALSSCPGDFTVPSDPGQVTAIVTWPAPTATDSCDVGLITAVCNPPSGSTFEVGTTMVACSATNSCGISDDSCVFSVTVEATILTVDVELSSTVDPGPFQRCITFEVWDCDGSPGAQKAIIEQNLSFINGLASGVNVPLPGGAWECVTARDTLHTLRSTAPDFTTTDGTEYTASFVAPRAQGGHWLVGGNLNDDEFVDIRDFGVLFPMHLSLANPNTPCGTPGPDGNINGDNLVDLLDLVIFVGNSLQAAEPNCCGTGGVSEASGPIMAISVQELRTMGLDHMIAADINRDGILNMEDVAALMRGGTPFSGDRGSLRKRQKDGRSRSGR